MVRSIWTTYVTRVREAADAEAAAHLAAVPAAEADRRAIVVLLTVTVTLLLLRYFGNDDDLRTVRLVLGAVGLGDAAEALDGWLRSEPSRFHHQLYWAIARVVAYFVIPIAVVKLVLRGSLRDHGLEWRGLHRQAGVYAVLAAVVLPVVVLASYGERFQAKYPYYVPEPGEPLFPYFIGWELLYALQFVGLELFYRGFMVHGLRRRLGYLSVFVMMVPYMMIHSGKPFAEAAGSIVAGFVLGSLSLKSRSVWWGAALHVLVAWTMDGLALWHRGLL